MVDSKYHGRNSLGYFQRLPIAIEESQAVPKTVGSLKDSVTRYFLIAFRIFF